MRSLHYNGSMVYQPLNDSEVRANYQHKHVVDMYLKHFKNKKVLDAGCWTGTMEKEVQRRNIGTEMVGIDQNKDALKVASKGFPKFKFAQIELDKPDEKFVKKYRGYFDTVIFLDVIEHIPVGTEVKILQFLRDMLKPGGVLILSTMLDHKYNFIDPAWFFGHRHYPAMVIRKQIKKSGLKPVEVLKLGNLYWDLDLLLLYIYKHIFQKNYRTTEWMYKKIYEGLEPPQKYATRIYALAKK
jgi:cyclopropane fatty-acyl-phospholipid synthase-like methyltransferase